MHEDLRRKALNSGKTVSKKARSRQISQNHSAASSLNNSRANSRVQSRNASDDEDGGGNLSDETSFSINSVDEFLASDEFNEQGLDSQRRELRERIERICDRKGSGYKDREESLAAYSQILTAHYLADELYGHVVPLVSAFGRSIKTESTERESVLAIKALALTMVTVQDDVDHDGVIDLLKRTISDSQSLAAKAAAIHGLGVSVAFGDAGESEIGETLSFLDEIASSDGSYVDAPDDADTVVAALQEYGFLATYVADLEAESEDAMSTFLDQLDSDQVEVQVAAGENIALLYEKSYTPQEEDETISDRDETEGHSSSGEDSGSSDGPRLIKRYNAYHNGHEVLVKVQGLATLSSRKLNKVDKRKLHQSFSSITMTVENPRRGLQTNNASRMMIRIQRGGEMKVDQWWKLMRLNALRRLLQGGFVNHYYEGNKQVLDTLPLIMRDAQSRGIRSPGLDKGKKGRWKDSPKRQLREFGDD